MTPADVDDCPPAAPQPPVPDAAREARDWHDTQAMIASEAMWGERRRGLAGSGWEESYKRHARFSNAIRDLTARADRAEAEAKALRLVVSMLVDDCDAARRMKTGTWVGSQLEEFARDALARTGEPQAVEDKRQVCDYPACSVRGSGHPLACNCRALPTSAVGGPYQGRVMAWLLECFGPGITNDRVEHVHRFWEEALELGQSAGCTASEAHQLVDYVFERETGELGQEIGGTLVCLAALCAGHGIDMDVEGERELARVWTKVEKIRAKHAAKPKFFPLPGSAAVGGEG